MTEDAKKEGQELEADGMFTVWSDNEDPSLAPVVNLPGYEETTEQKVLLSVKKLFKGFEGKSAAELKFESVDGLSTYTENTMSEIRRVRQDAESSDLLNKAAVMSRFWYLGTTVDTALKNGGYGTNAINKLSTALRKSLTYLYQMRAVAVRLTVVDCYLLGMRGLDTTHLRQLAQVKDDATRKGLMKAFVDSIRDTSDKAAMDRAKKAFVAALRSAGSLSEEALNTSDPFNGGSDVQVSPEWNDLMQNIELWTRLLKKPSDTKKTEAICNALADFYLKETAPDAEIRLSEVKEHAETLKAMVKATKDNLEDILKELDSMLETELTSVGVGA